MLSCVLIASAHAQQDSQPKPAPKKSATSTTSKKTNSPKPHSKSTSARKTSTAAAHTSLKKRSSRKKTARSRGQQKIDAERAEEIQQALIREHYMTGEATGTWNQASEDAMRKYQADHGWQSKTVPDSRALISLGLGPSKDHLLNPESAMTTVPDRPKSQPTPPSSHAAPATSDPATAGPATSNPATSDPVPQPLSPGSTTGDPAGPR